MVDQKAKIQKGPKKRREWQISLPQDVVGLVLFKQNAKKICKDRIIYRDGDAVFQMRNRYEK